MRSTIPALLLLLLLAACAGPRPAPIPGPHVVYSCEDGLVLRVRFARDGAHVTLPSGEQVYLPQHPVASGTSYASPQHELRGKGDEIMWTTGRRVPIGCRVQR